MDRNFLTSLWKSSKNNMKTYLTIFYINLFKVNNGNTRKVCEKCSKLTWIHRRRKLVIKTQGVLIVNFGRRSYVFIINFEQILHNVLVFLLLTLNKQILAGFEKRKERIRARVFLLCWDWGGMGYVCGIMICAIWYHLYNLNNIQKKWQLY